MAIRLDWSAYPDRERRKAFTEGLIPECPLPSAGVSVPECRKVARSLDGCDIEIVYIEDVLVKGIWIFSAKEPFRVKKERIEAFLPLLVSWMVTDVVTSSLHLDKCDEEEAYTYFLSLMDRSDEMVRRLGIVALMRRAFMTRERMEEVLDRLTAVRTEHHLLAMGAAWYLATAYIKDPELALPYFKRVDSLIAKMARQKCRDSRRLDKEAKARLDKS